MTKMLPDRQGHFGVFGGRYVAETLMPALIDLEQSYGEARKDRDFQSEFKRYLRDYSGRETPLYFARRLTEDLGAPGST
jgi:tryptophan synthase beta chain